MEKSENSEQKKMELEKFVFKQVDSLAREIMENFGIPKWAEFCEDGRSDFELQFNDKNPSCSSFIRQLAKTRFLTLPSCESAYVTLSQHDKLETSKEFFKILSQQKYNRFYLSNDTFSKLSLGKYSAQLFSIMRNTQMNVQLVGVSIGSTHLFKRILQACSNLSNKLSIEKCYINSKSFSLPKQVDHKLKKLKFRRCTISDRVPLNFESATFKIILESVSKSMWKGSNSNYSLAMVNINGTKLMLDEILG
ncbi:unnamed protein product [Moneuplotes crassus]|uniref:Uncharacterized protein n=1 Tax=Euplotes crassus TaxID=5936 RepID=A0AAD2D4C2_EUPCR|nr:unnamed protein product [Moneuplotes crassus]